MLKNFGVFSFLWSWKLTCFLTACLNATLYVNFDLRGLNLLLKIQFQELIVWFLANNLREI